MINSSKQQDKRVRYINKQIKHIMQMTKNDCGVACLKMAWLYLFNDLNELTNDHLDQVLARLGVKNFSLWTIDIAHICALNNLSHCMYTITWGVQDSYVNEDFYSKEREFTFEKNRINNLFDNSSKLGIQIKQESIDLEFIKQEISSKKCVCICLVDSMLLNGKNCYENECDLNDLIDNLDEEMTASSSSSNDNVISSPTTNNCCFSIKNKETKKVENDLNKLVDSSVVKNSQNKYLGHFIVLIGYDDLKSCVYYRNPASIKNMSYTSYVNLEIARKSFGTDQDILFIYGVKNLFNT